MLEVNREFIQVPECLYGYGSDLIWPDPTKLPVSRWKASKMPESLNFTWWMRDIRVGNLKRSILRAWLVRVFHVLKWPCGRGRTAWRHRTIGGHVHRVPDSIYPARMWLNARIRIVPLLPRDLQTGKLKPQLSSSAETCGQNSNAKAWICYISSSGDGWCMQGIRFPRHVAIR